ncbi:ciliogenesis-associated TTC17-interacting protein [Indicator indicator]|uniref:ciliogenesis-associated TTC17-interacting protein n=1 Tax=Indicator indicator TaxID=1002788 RepID=UPI0023DFBEBC|nr:ciliogenesis-associated TTC17-interacting protein [Indicator indicator]
MEPPAEGRQESSALTEAAAEFLGLIGLEDLDRCVFAETLEVVAEGRQPRGQAGAQWWAAVQWAPYEQMGKPARICLLVQAHGRQDGMPGSRTLKAYVTPQLETLEQEEQERLELEEYPIERRTHIISHHHGMTVTKILQEGEAEPQCWSFSYSQAKLRGLLLEGASLLLLRVLACRQAVPPGLIFPAFDIQGHLCTSSYHALGTQQQAVGSVEMEVFVIEQILHTGTDISTVWHSSFLPSGHLARLVQVGCPVEMLLQDESVLTQKGGIKLQPHFAKQPLDWEEDIQLYSWFLERKEELQVTYTTYVQQHPELKAQMADFLLALLLQQPHDSVSFAAQFFTPFDYQQPPGDRFASLTGNKAASTARPGLFALEKLRHREGRGC